MRGAIVAKAGETRVLVVCAGNTCRSPVLSLLLAAELHRIGRDDVKVLSAAADESLAPFSFRMNEFAIEGLREVLVARNDVECEGLLRQARKHKSKGLSSFRNQRFDLIAVVERVCASELQKWRIVARETDARDIPDDGYRALKNAHFPLKPEDDTSKEVLNAYRQQTASLLKYATYLVARVTRLASHT
jgi:protein-tyrosine-phosphatase